MKRPWSPGRNSSLFVVIILRPSINAVCFFTLRGNRLETALHESGVQKMLLVFDSNRGSQPLVHQKSLLGYAP
jgi:hypothetical protein